MGNFLEWNITHWEVSHNTVPCMEYAGIGRGFRTIPLLGWAMGYPKKLFRCMVSTVLQPLYKMKVDQKSIPCSEMIIPELIKRHDSNSSEDMAGPRDESEAFVGGAADVAGHVCLLKTGM